MAGSHQRYGVGNALDYSAKKLGISHRTVFDMRHKIFLALQELPEAVGRKGDAYAATVNRAKPDTEQLSDLFAASYNNADALVKQICQALLNY